MFSFCLFWVLLVCGVFWWCGIKWKMATLLKCCFGQFVCVREGLRDFLPVCVSFMRKARAGCGVCCVGLCMCRTSPHKRATVTTLPSRDTHQKVLRCTLRKTSCLRVCFREWGLWCHAVEVVCECRHGGSCQQKKNRSCHHPKKKAAGKSPAAFCFLGRGVGCGFCLWREEEGSWTRSTQTETVRDSQRQTDERTDRQRKDKNKTRQTRDKRHTRQTREKTRNQVDNKNDSGQNTYATPLIHFTGEVWARATRRGFVWIKKSLFYRSVRFSSDVGGLHHWPLQGGRRGHIPPKWTNGANKSIWSRHLQRHRHRQRQRRQRQPRKRRKLKISKCGRHKVHFVFILRMFFPEKLRFAHHDHRADIYCCCDVTRLGRDDECKMMSSFLQRVATVCRQHSIRRKNRPCNQSLLKRRKGPPTAVYPASITASEMSTRSEIISQNITRHRPGLGWDKGLTVVRGRLLAKGPDSSFGGAPVRSCLDEIHMEEEGVHIKVQAEEEEIGETHGREQDGE